MTKYNFVCLDCGKMLRKTTDKQKIKCVCGSNNTKCIGKPSILGGSSDNGIAGSSKFVDLDRV